MSETFTAALVYLDRERPTELIKLPYSAPSAPSTLRRAITIAGEPFFEVFQLASSAEWPVHTTYTFEGIIPRTVEV